MLTNIFNWNFFTYVLYFLSIPIGYLNPTLNWIVILGGPLLLYKYNSPPLLENQRKYLLILTFFLAVILLTGIFSIDPHYPLKIALNVFSIIIASFFVSRRLESKEDILLFFKGVFWASMIYTVLLYIIVFDGRILNFVESETFGKNTSSLILFIGLISSMLLSILQKSKLLYIINFLFFVSIFLTGSIKIIVVSTVLLLFFLIFREGIKFKNTIIGLISITLFFVFADLYIFKFNLLDNQAFVRIISRLSVLFGGDSSIAYIDADYMTAVRANLIHEGLDKFYENPFWGIGMENTRLSLGTYTHNNFVEILAGTGIIGFFLFCYALLILIQSSFKVTINKIRIILLLSIACFIIVANAQRIYDNRYLMVFLVSFIPIHKYIKYERA